MTSAVVKAGRVPLHPRAAFPSPPVNGRKAPRNGLVILSLQTAADNDGSPGKRLFFAADT
jgi:hypothetical protein